MTGYIHSIESMGLVDGPGVRSVVFLQGCRLRCRYCHNPDTWQLPDDCGNRIPAEELVSRLIRFKPYYGEFGGVTFSGGEPLLQKDFLLEALKLLKKEGIHTCLDTAGVGNGSPKDYKDILSYTDLVLYDVKHYTPEGYNMVTKRKFSDAQPFLNVLQQSDTPIWVRHVVTPGLTDGEEHLGGLLEYVKKLKNVQKIELLPYHVLGVEKYHKLGIPYDLEGTPPMDSSQLATWQQRMDEIC